MAKKKQPPSNHRTNPPPSHPAPGPTPATLREQILDSFRTLKIPVTDQQWDEVLARAEREGLSHLEFVHALISDQAAQRRQRSIERRIQEAHFRDSGTLENFDWTFNAATIDRAWFEELERMDCPVAAHLLYKVMEVRYPRRSTALVTNVDFETGNDYLGDPPLAMAFLDRLVDGALLLKLEGKSYRAPRARRLDAKKDADSTPTPPHAD